jgi:hypothetical protein
MNVMEKVHWTRALESEILSALIIMSVLGCPVGYMNVKRAPGPSWSVREAMDSSDMSMYPPGHSNLFLEPSMMSTYTTGHSSMAMDSSMTFMYPTGHSSTAIDSSVMFMYPTGHPSVAMDSSATSMCPPGTRGRHWTLP